MAATGSFFTQSRVKGFNALCLLLSVIVVLFLPVKKEIWYDETVSVLCAKGLYMQDTASFQHSGVVTSAQLNAYNTQSNVLHTTVVDNGNSFLYNSLLHWFTSLFGNTVQNYILLSRICGAATLVAFFTLCSLIMGASVFTGIAVLLLLFDGIFWGMSHEIRAYELAMLLVTICGIYFYKFTFVKDSAFNLLLTGLFAVGALLSHYLSASIIATMVLFLLYYKKSKLFNVANIAAVAVPLVLLGLYFYAAADGFRIMSGQNTKITERKSAELFTTFNALLLAIRFTAINFKAVFPAIIPSNVVKIFSFLLLITVWIAALTKSRTKQQKQLLILFFMLGISSSLFLFALSIKAGHYTPLYSRYFTFCIPFTTLSTVYMLYILFQSGLQKLLLAPLAALFIVLPAIIWAKTIMNPATINYSHIAVAKKAKDSGVKYIIVKSCDDAFLINCFLPANQLVNYRLNRDINDFILDSGSAAQAIIPIVKFDH